jgi:hypothetical protein
MALVNATPLVDALFGAVNAELVDDIMKRLGKIALPWRPNSSLPPCFERRLATGKPLGTVSARLGTYTWAHTPRHHGWGYHVSRGSSVHEGIVAVEWDPSWEEAAIKRAEVEAMVKAMIQVDEFLMEEWSALLLLPDDPGSFWNEEA